MYKIFQCKAFIILIALHILCIANKSFGQNKSKDKYLFKLGSEEFFSDEFEYYFFKNNNNLTTDSVKFKTEEYLDLYINFRLKVKEALSLGNEKNPDFIKELNGYKSQLIKPYLIESKITKSLVLETYERMKEERLASHILLKVSQDALPEDTLKRYKEILEIKRNIESGQKFDSLAFILSEDPSAKSNRGSLGYFSAMQMVYSFEEAAFNTPVGKLAGPIRTKFGYHLIKVHDKRPSKGKVQVAHIMMRVNPQNKGSNDIVRKKIHSVYDKLMNGEDWKTLCELHSEDVNTSKRGGALNWFGTGNIVKEFEDAAFALDTIGSISKPIQTTYGWHIIKLLGKKGLQPFDEVRPKLESRLSRDASSRITKDKSISLIKKQHGFNIDYANKSIALSELDSSLLKGKWVVDSTSSDTSKTIFTLGTYRYTIKDFWQYVTSRQKKRAHSNLSSYKKDLYNRFEEKSIFDYEEKNLVETNFDYRMILEEYRNGILLFDLMEEKVWQKAVKDTVGQKEYYEKNTSKYVANENAEIRVFVSDNQETILKSRDYLESSKKEIDSVFNAIEPLNLQASEKVVEKGEDEMLINYWKQGVHQTSKDGRHFLISVKKINPSGIKDFNKTRGAVISDYQKELEDQWISSLKSKYPIKLNKGTLKKVIDKIEKGL